MTTTRITWLNMIWLLFISFLPFSTAWIGHALFKNIPIMFYLANMALSALVYLYLQYEVIKQVEKNSKEEKEIRKTISIWLIVLLIFWFIPLEI